MKRVIRHIVKGSALFAVTIFSAGCGDLDPYGGSGGGYRDRYGYGYDDRYRDRYRDRYDYERDRARDERRRLEEERDRLEDERRRWENEHRHRDRYHNHPSYPPPPVAQSCPSGFHPAGSRRCSKDERKRGCKDIRVSSDLVCINF